MKDDVATAIGKLHKTERLVPDPARKPDLDCVDFEPAWAAFETARK